MSNRINLQEPFQGRRWLRLVVPDDRCGFRLKADVSVKTDDLGFECTTNRLGLRGPCDEEAANVVFGTSFAMAVGVDDRDTWHYLTLPQSNWLNLGLAVGIREWSQLAKLHHRGPKHRAIVIYHPNIWAHCLMYERWRVSGKDVFASLHWRRDFLGCAMLQCRRWVNTPARIRQGRLIRFTHEGTTYSVDAEYARICPSSHEEMVRRNLAELIRLLQPFSDVWCVRVPVKQQFVPAGYVNAELRHTLSTYEELWHTTRSQLQQSQNQPVNIAEPLIFDLSDYFPNDTHWNAKGNAKFASWFSSTLTHRN